MFLKLQKRWFDRMVTSLTRFNRRGWGPSTLSVSRTEPLKFVQRCRVEIGYGRVKNYFRSITNYKNEFIVNTFHLICYIVKLCGCCQPIMLTVNDPLPEKLIWSRSEVTRNTSATEWRVEISGWIRLCIGASIARRTSIPPSDGQSKCWSPKCNVKIANISWRHCIIVVCCRMVLSQLNFIHMVCNGFRQV